MSAAMEARARQADSLTGNERLQKMNVLESVTGNFVRGSREILAENLVGVYLHGSAVMGCFNEKKSDIDLLVVVKEEIPDEVKKRYMDMVVRLNETAPQKGIEMSIVRKNACKPFVYPTPFELHFSITHLEWYRTAPSDYIDRMKGVDKDLAAHVTILCHRGKCLFGEKISDIFEDVKAEYYLDSIWNDVADAEEAIRTNPTYIILNLCRVAAYVEEGLILSKQEGGSWGTGRLPGQYSSLIRAALEDYRSGEPFELDGDCACEFAAYMTERIRKETGRAFV